MPRVKFLSMQSSRPDWITAAFLLLGLLQYLLNKFQHVQDGVSKLVLRRDCTNGSPSSVSVDKWILFRMLLITFYCSEGFGSTKLSNLLVPSFQDNNTNMFDTRASFTHSLLGRRAFSSHAPHFWNCLSSFLRCCDDVDVFNKDLKTFLWTDYAYLNERYSRFF